MTDAVEIALDPLPAELADARAHLGEGSDDEVAAFARRQGAAMARYAALEKFYAANSCRMAVLHSLGGGVAVLSRFPGASAAFERIGALLQPIDAEGRPRDARWKVYARACELGRALEVRDELWIAAHVVDLQQVRREGLEAAFEREAARHPERPVWRLMKNHFAFTLGTRQSDESAAAGAIALETAMSNAIGSSVSRMLRDGGWTFARTLVLGLVAFFSWAEVRPGAPSYRRIALAVLRHAVSALAIVGVWRKGLREAGRGESGAAAQWPILAQTLGDRVGEVHPLVVGFYNNPARYDVRCTLDLYTAPARFWSWMLTMVAGQGLYEAGTRTYEARIRTYRRADGSMHFVREIDTGRALRVFDSDFLVREHRGVPTLFERFAEANLEYELTVTPLGPGLGVSIRGRNLYWRGLHLPTIGLEVEFRSSVEETPEGAVLRLEGLLAQRPRTAFGRFLAYRVLRRPELLGCIRYVAVPRAAAPEDHPWPFLS
jgi:hypothetical protein